MAEASPKFKVSTTPLEGLLLIEPRVFADARGHFVEAYNRRDFAALGIDLEFVQDNRSSSCKGALRGLHFQTARPQAKLVWVVRGSVFDVAVDLRRGSRTCGQWHGLRLSAEEPRLFFIPAGFAHGFLALTDQAEFAYKCSDYYDPQGEAGIAWDDPDLAIQWPLAEVGSVQLSDKDRALPRLRQQAFRF